MRNLLLLSILLSIIQAGCMSDVEENTYTCEEQGEFLGEYLLMPESNEYWAYNANQKRIYVNSTGDEIEFTPSNYQETVNQMNIRTICGSWQTPIQEFDFVRVERKSTTYSSNSLNIGFFVSLESSIINVDEDSEQIIDVLYISGNSYYSLTVSDRGNSANIPSYLQKDNLETISDTTLFGRNFSDLYYDDIYEQPTYFNKSQGIVAFYDFSNNFYVLDRIE